MARTSHYIVGHTENSYDRIIPVEIEWIWSAILAKPYLKWITIFILLANYHFLQNGPNNLHNSNVFYIRYSHVSLHC